MGTLDGKVILVTGAASGIGRAVAAATAREGAALALGDIDKDHLANLADELGADADTSAVSTRVVDVAEPESVAEFVDEAAATHGRIDGVVCSAGTTSSAPAIELDLDAWQRIIAINLTGTFLTVQRAARAMIAGGNGGSIVTVSSALALTGQRNGVHYAASKAGVIGLTKTFALELGRSGIRVNNLAPGATESPLLRRTVSAEFLEGWVERNPMGRLGQPEDHAALVGFLLSDASNWITGQTFHVNGGSIMP